MATLTNIPFDEIRVGDTLTVHLAVTEKKDRARLVTLDCTVMNQHGVKVATGVAEVIAPERKLMVEIKAVS
jgi:phosphate acetyltransferase